MINLEEELFSTKYELHTLSELLIRGEAERWVKGFLHPKYEDEHMLRYQYASKLVREKKTLDIACGSGYGSFFLATAGGAKEVVGVDLDGDAIRYGTHRYPHSAIKRMQGEACTFQGSELFDVIISFETIEHIPEYETFLKNLANNLTPDGLLLISTPLQKSTVVAPEHNPYHVIEWSYKDFVSLVEKYFKVKKALFQNILIKGNYPPYTMKNRVLNKLGIKEYKKSPDTFLKGFSTMDEVNLNEIMSGYLLLELQKN